MIDSATVKQSVKQSVKQAMSGEAILAEGVKLLRGGTKGGKPTLLASIPTAGSGRMVTEQTPGYETLVRMGLIPRTISEKEYLANPAKWKDYNVIAPSLEHKNVAIGALPSELDNKAMEQSLYSKFMPKTLQSEPSPAGNLGAMLESADPKAALKTHFGNDKWLLKDVHGAATKPDELLTPDNIVAMNRDKDQLKLKLRNGSIKLHKIKDFIAQERRDITAPSYYRWADKALSKIIPAGMLKNLTTLNRGTQEYRVHLLDGKVVPEGTSGRGTISQYLGSIMTPVATPDMRKAEELATQIGKSMAPKHRKGLYGLDIGIESGTGKPFLIETNPGSLSGHSGFMDTLSGSDAIASAYEGRTPVMRRAKQGLGILGGAGVAGLGAAAYGKSRDKQEPRQETALAGIRRRLRHYTSQA